MLSLIFCNQCAETNGDLPNVMIIMADDLGWNQLGCYGGPYHTPHIDSLAISGIRFVNAYSSAAVCSPTRAALMTGKYPARLHLTDFIKGNHFPDSLLIQPEWQKYLPLEETTLAEVFGSQGYRTALYGKWHLSQEKKPPGSLPYNPDRQGFDDFLITYKPQQGISNPEGDPHNIDSITERAIAFLEKNAEEPFLLVVSHNAIHDPVMESSSRIQSYQDMFSNPGYHVEPVIGAMVGHLDEGTGRLLSKLKELELEENTIVLFCSDNGGKASYASQYPLRKGKGWLYEGGIRVPMIVRWPERIKPGKISGIVTSTIDIFPTLIELAELPPVVDSIDGRSIADELLGRGKTEERIYYWHYPHYHIGTGMKPASAIRSGRYKLIEWHEEYLTGRDAWELFDLVSDPGETKDLSKEQPQRTESMRSDLHSWRKMIGAQMPQCPIKDK